MLSFPPKNLSKSRFFHADRLSKYYLDYLLSFGIVALVTLLGLIVRDHINPTNLVMPYLLGVVSIAALYGRGPAVFASVLGVVAFDIFLVPPYLTFVVEDTEYIITFLTLFLVGAVISSLTAKIKEQVQAAQEREARILSLYNLSQDLTGAYALEDVTKAITENIGNALRRNVWLFLADGGATSENPPNFKMIAAPGAKSKPIDEGIRFTYARGLVSGPGADYYPQGDTINLPLVTNTGNVGVISIATRHTTDENNRAMLQLFEAFANLSAFALERIQLSQQASQTQILKAKDKFQAILLNSVSHDFRTPLVTITGTLSSLDDELYQLDRDTQQKLIRDALGEAEKLNRLVSNLLNISRLESGALELQSGIVDVQDLIGATLEQMKNRFNRPISIQIPEAPPLISADFVLIEQALMNILDNAVKYSPDDSGVEIIVYQDGEQVYMDILDRGQGIPQNELPLIFDKFYRGTAKPGPGGTGLGLAIAKGIIEAHGAELSAIPRNGGGMIFRMGFPQVASPR